MPEGLILPILHLDWMVVNVPDSSRREGTKPNAAIYADESDYNYT